MSRRSQEKVEQREILQFLNLQTAAKEIGISRQSLSKLVQSGQVPVLKISKRIFVVERNEWEEWKARRQRRQQKPE